MPLLIRRPLAVHHYHRSFSTSTATLAIFLDGPHSTIDDTVPAYPYGPARWYKQSDRGLYAGQRIQFGHNVGKKIAVKTPRKFQINVFRKRIFSKALSAFVRVKVSARALRTIDKVGGLDEYLLGEKEGRIKELGVTGWKLRWAVMQAMSVRQRFDKQRKELGLNELEEEVKRLEEQVEALRLAGEAESEGDVDAEAAVDEERQSEITTHADSAELALPNARLTAPRSIKLHLGTDQTLVLKRDGWRHRPGRRKPRRGKAKWRS